MTPNMSSFRLFSLPFVAFLGLGLNSVSVQAQFDASHIRAVDASGATCGDGTAWNTAYRYLQDALQFASTHPEIDEIWVKAGEYFVDQDCANPGGTGLRTATFALIEGVSIYGGFDGTEILLIERDPVLNLTTLSGVLVPPDPSDPPGACTDPPPGAGDCFTVTPEIPGCTNVNCCDVVCDQDPGCCLDEWDEFCVFIATQSCGLNVYHVVTPVRAGLPRTRFSTASPSLGARHSAGPAFRTRAAGYLWTAPNRPLCAAISREMSGSRVAAHLLEERTHS